MSYPTLAEVVAAHTVPGVKWPGGVITYSIPVAGSTWLGYPAGSEPFKVGYRPLSAAEAEAFRAAMAAWARLTAVEFVETDDLTAPGQIRIAISDLGPLYAGQAGLPGSEVGAGDVWISESHAWGYPDRTIPNVYLYHHEIGHALGFKHPFEGGPVLPDEYLGPRYSLISTNRGPADFLWMEQDFSEPLRFTAPALFEIAAIQALYGANPKTGAGDTTYSWSQARPFIEAIYDAGGIDTFDLSNITRPSTVDLTPGAFSSVGYWSVADQSAAFRGGVTILPSIAAVTYTWSNNVGIAFSTVIENIIGGSGADTLKGNLAANRITGARGDDTIDGGAGVDAALYGGASSDYTWTLRQDGAWEVRDRRASNGEGVDILSNIEVLKFSDTAVALPMAQASAWSTALTSILRLSSSGWDKTTAAGSVIYQISGGLTDSQAVAEMIKAAGATTSVATLAYQFFTGGIPGSGGMDYLVSPTGPNANNLNSAYYQSFNLENRYINFSVNLGRDGEGKAKFLADYGSLNLAQAMKKAYGVIFGNAPSDGMVQTLLSGGRDAYFESYGKDGPNGQGTKAAMVGWLLAEAVKADVGMYARANDAFLTDLADGATFGVDLIGVYGKPDFNYG